MVGGRTGAGRSGYEGEGWSGRRVIGELAANMAHIAAGERGEDTETTFAEDEAAPRRRRYWTDGTGIGAEFPVLEIAARSRTPRTRRACPLLR